MQAIFKQYQRDNSADPADRRDVGAWAIKQKLWEPRPSDIYARFAADMADALREEYRTDRAGRRYRAKHAVRQTVDGKQTSFWADIDLAPRAHMEKAFGQRRRQVVGDCHQLRLDVDHYNSVHEESAPYNLVLDFTDDVEEMLVASGIDQAA
jgi:hypothetical protein